jgi:hypothetical protein
VIRRVSGARRLSRRHVIVRHSDVPAATHALTVRASFVHVADHAQLIHGARRTYRRDCRCVACRAANARYWCAWWTAKQGGRPLLGARISAVEAQRG